MNHEKTTKHSSYKGSGKITKVGFRRGSSLNKGRATYYEKPRINPHPLGKNPGGAGTRRYDKRARLAIKRRMHTFYAHSRRGPEYDNPTGKNPGDFWSINKRPFSGAHFAVFPEEICLKPILSSCPQWVCNKCGKPKKRITATEYEKHRPSGGEYTRTSAGEKRAQTGNWGTMTNNLIARHSTIGWTGCNCNAGYHPGTVLDPFGGAGTVGVVAKRLGRNFILIELNRDYCKMAKGRIAKTIQLAHCNK